MKHLAAGLIAILACCALSRPALATKRSFSDILTKSPSGRYQVEANSPDNADPNKPKFFQSNFTYTCRDTFTNAILWTRKQAMEEPELQEDGSRSTYQSWIEDSPVGLFVSDDGWTVIYTGAHELIVVDKHGRDRGKVRLISEGFTLAERERYVHETTAGPIWFGDNDHFFRNIGKNALFVTRPAWGRAVIINLETGKLNDEKAASTKAIRAGDYTRPWDDPKRLTRMIAYALSLMLIPFVIGYGIWMQRRAACGRLPTGASFEQGKNSRHLTP